MMMKRKWRQCALKALSLAATGLLLTGCTQAVGGSAASADTRDVQNADGGSAEKQEVRLWYSGGKTAAGTFASIIQEFNETQDKYEVTGVVLADYDETYEKLQASIAGRKAPDLVLLDSDKAYSLASKGILADIGEYAGQDPEFQEEDFIPVFYQQGLMENGSMFAMPAYGTTQVMYYNRQLWEQAGIQSGDIKSWQDLAEAAEQITVKQDGKTVVYGWEPMYDEGNLIDAAYSNGASLLSGDGTQVLINSREWVEVWEAFRIWIHEEEIMRIHYGGQGWEYWYQTMDDVLQNKAGGYTGSAGDQADLDFSVVAAMEQPGFGSHESAPAARVLQLVMPESDNEEAKQGAYAFAKYFSDPARQAKWSMETGYVAVRQSTLEDPDFQAYAKENPQILVPISQAKHASVWPVDPTGGKIYDALKIAADQVEVEGISAEEALDQAQKTAQEALDQALKP